VKSALSVFDEMRRSGDRRLVERKLRAGDTPATADKKETPPLPPRPRGETILDEGGGMKDEEKLKSESGKLNTNPSGSGTIYRARLCFENRIPNDERDSVRGRTE